MAGLLETSESVAIHCRIIHELNVQVGCYSFHYDIKLTRYFSELLPSFRNHLPLFFHTSKLWLQKHLTMMRVDRNQAD